MTATATVLVWMRLWIVTAVIAGAALPLAAAETAGQRVVVKLNVAGELFAPPGRDADPARQPITVAAALDFLETPENGSPTGPQAVVARQYFDATAEISVGGEQSRTVLAGDARTLAVARLGTTPLPFLREAFLSREEADLLETPFDSILLEELLPHGPVGDGDAWQIAGDVTAGLLAIDMVESGTLDAKLIEVVDGTAKVLVSGVIDGAVDGMPTHVVVEGTFTAPAREEEDLHVVDGKVSRVEIVLRERRQASHVAPGFEVEARLDVERLPADVADQAAVTDEATVVDEATQRRRGAGRPGFLWQRDAEGRYDIVYDARWRTVEESAAGLVMRLVDHGALVAQCSITALPRADADVTPTINEVKRDIQKSLSGQFGQFEAATESKLGEAADANGTGDEVEGGRINIVRVASTGTAEGLPFHWIHYVVSDGDGRRASVTFMLEASLRKRFGDADQALVNGLRFVPAAPKEARLPEKTAVP